MNPDQHNQFRQKVIFCQVRFSLVSVERFEVFWHDVLLLLPLLNIVFFEHGELQQIAVGNVVQNRIAQNLQLFVAPVEIVCVFE